MPICNIILDNGKGEDMKIQESTEDYLESIYVIKREKGTVRSIDIANHLGYSKPTISIAMKKLRENKMVEVDNEGHITLTEKGLSIAEKTFEKHNIIAQLLISLGVSDETAFHDACHIEHCLSDETFLAIKSHWKDHSK